MRRLILTHILLLTIVAAGCVDLDGEAIEAREDVASRARSSDLQPDNEGAALEALLLDTSRRPSASCPAPQTCPGYGSCTSWATYAGCESVPSCTPDACEKCTGAGCFIGALKETTTYSYRLCFNEQSQSCQEIRATIISEMCSLVPCN